MSRPSPTASESLAPTTPAPSNPEEIWLVLRGRPKSEKPESATVGRARQDAATEASAWVPVRVT